MTQPYVIHRGYCASCGDPRDENHPLCEVVLQHLELGYCAECGGDIVDGLHDDCVYTAAAKAGRPDLLGPPTAEELAWLERLTSAISAAIDQTPEEGDEGRRRQGYFWN